MKIAFIGGGNMAQALIGGMLKRDFVAADIHVLEIDAGRQAQLRAALGVDTQSDAGPWLQACDLVVLAVKPQQIREASASIAPLLGKALVLSIAAGVRASTLARWLKSSNVVRAMPNTPALIGLGVTGLAALPGVSPQDRAQAERVMAAVGAVLWFADESRLDAVTALSGSGPAYIFYFIEAMQRAGEELGLDATAARRLVIDTFIGAAQLAAQSAEPIQVLRENVTSKGGTTAAALASFDAHEVGASIVKALKAAAARGAELGDELDQP